MSQAVVAAKLFQARDLFVHDGSHLRRLRLSTPAQMAMLFAMLLAIVRPETWFKKPRSPRFGPHNA